MSLTEKMHIVKSQLTHRLTRVPIVILMPHSACNCRCVMCDIWKANSNRQQMPVEMLQQHLQAFRVLGVRQVILSGGEPLMHENLWAFCRALKSIPVKITLLSTGLLLARHAREVVRYSDEVIVSLDGSPEVHNRIRNLPRAFEKLAAGIAALRGVAPDFRITGRCVVQKLNFLDLPHIIATAKELGLDQMSFLTVDVKSTGFNRAQPWDEQKVSQIALDEQEVRAFERVIEQVIQTFQLDFKTGFIAELPQQLRRMPQYFSALLGKCPFPTPRCNAPWVSTVIETDGTVRPCFFHPPLGHLGQGTLSQVLNSPRALAFRKSLFVPQNPTCQSCTCSLYLDPVQLPQRKT